MRRFPCLSVIFFSIFLFALTFPTFIFVRVGLALMSELHCYLGSRLLAAVGETIWCIWHGARLGPQFSNRRGRRWRPAHRMCLMQPDGQQTACHDCWKTTALCRGEENDLQCQKKTLCTCFYYSADASGFPMFSCLHGPYRIICLCRFHAGLCDNIKLQCKLYNLHCPSVPHQAPLTDKTLASYHFICLMNYSVLANGAVLVFLELYKSSLTSAEGPIVLISCRMKVMSPSVHVTQIR